jgi:hypothetical protein
VVLERNDVDDVVDEVIMAVEDGLAPRAQLMADLRLELPALRRHQVGVTGIFALVGKLGLRQEVIETDLADLPAGLQADVPFLGRTPANDKAALRTEEAARRQVVVDPVEP